MKVAVAIPTTGRACLAEAVASIARQTRRADQLIVCCQGGAGPLSGFQWAVVGAPDSPSPAPSPTGVREGVLSSPDALGSPSDSGLRPSPPAPSPRGGEGVLSSEFLWIADDGRGLSRSRNQIVSHFDGEWLLWFDDDQTLAADALANLGRLIERYPEHKIFGGSCLEPLNMKAGDSCDVLNPLREVEVTRDTWAKPHPDSVTADLWGGISAYHRSVFEKVGRYDEHLGAGSPTFTRGEDTDYVARALTAGFEGILSPRIQMEHTYGARPAETWNVEDAVLVSAVLAWKAGKDPSRLSPEVAANLHAYGRKKAMLGPLFPEQAARKAVFEKTLARLDAEFELVEGVMVKK